MKLVDPTSAPLDQSLHRAPRLESLQGKTIGLLSNGKLNADALLLETAKLFEKHLGCQTNAIKYKPNPSAPTSREVIEAVASECDFVLTATGD